MGVKNGFPAQVRQYLWPCVVSGYWLPLCRSITAERILWMQGKYLFTGVLSHPFKFMPWDSDPTLIMDVKRHIHIWQPLCKFVDHINYSVHHPPMIVVDMTADCSLALPN